MKEVGFTLIELMIVVAIMAILSAIALPVMGEHIRKAKDGNTIKVIGTMRTASNMYLTDTIGNSGSLYADKITDLEIYFSSTIVKKLRNGDITTDTNDYITSYQMIAGRATKDGVPSMGWGDFAGITNVVEIYYNNENGEIYADGTNSGTGYRDMKNKLWSDY